MDIRTKYNVGQKVCVLRYDNVIEVGTVAEIKIDVISDKTKPNITYGVDILEDLRDNMVFVVESQVFGKSEEILDYFKEQINEINKFRENKI